MPLTREAKLALLALWDCRVVCASWYHPGYRQLRERRLASIVFSHDALWKHRLSDRGYAVAETLFGKDHRYVDHHES